MLTITNSDMGKFLACRRAWYLGYYRRLQRRDEPVVGPLPFGSRIHAALEAWEDGTVSSPVVAWHALMDHEYGVLAERDTFIPEKLSKEDALGQVMLEGYLEWAEQEGVDVGWEVLGVEKKLSDRFVLAVDTDGQPKVEVLVRGKLDRQLRRRSDGSRYVDDWKTARAFSQSTLSTLERSPQARLYMLLERAQYAENERPWVAGAVYTLLRKVLRTKTSKPPYYLRMAVNVSEHELEEYRLRTVAVAQQMLGVHAALDDGQDHRLVAPFTPSWQCDSCPFKHPCDLMRHTSAAAGEQMLTDLYIEQDPHARYLGEEETVLDVSLG